MHKNSFMALVKTGAADLQHEDKTFITRYARERVEEADGEYISEEIVENVFEHIFTCSKFAQSDYHINLNKIVASCIEQYEKMDEWSDLNRIAEHALKAAKRVCEKGDDDSLITSMADSFQADLEFMELPAHIRKKLAKEGKEMELKELRDKGFDV